MDDYQNDSRRSDREKFCSDLNRPKKRRNVRMTIENIAKFCDFQSEYTLDTTATLQTATDTHYFDLWTNDGTLERIHHALYEQCREQGSGKPVRPPPSSTARA
jgi:hypothetical protein